MKTVHLCFLLSTALALFVPSTVLWSCTPAPQQGNQSTLRKNSDSPDEPLPAKALLRLGIKQIQHAGPPLQLAISHDQSQVFSIDNTWLIAWELDTGRPIWRKKLTYSWRANSTPTSLGIRPFAIMPDSGKVVTSSRNGRLKFWDPQTGKSKTVKCPVNTTWKSVDVSPNSQLIAVGDSSGLWVCTPEGKEVYHVRNNSARNDSEQTDSDRKLPQDRIGGSVGPDENYAYGRFSPDGKVLALVKSEAPKTITLLEAKSGDEILKVDASEKIVRLAFSPDSKQIVTSEYDCSARLYDIETGEIVWSHVIPNGDQQSSYVSEIDFRPDGKQIAVGAMVDSQYRVRLLDASSGQDAGFLFAKGNAPWPFQFALDSERMVGSGWDSLVRAWDLEEVKLIAVDEGIRASGQCAMSGDGKHLAFTDTKTGIHLVDVETGNIVQSIEEPDSASFGRIMFNKTGSQLAVGFLNDAEVCLSVWDIESSERTHQWSWPRDNTKRVQINDLSFSDDGKRIAAAVTDQDLALVFDLESNDRLAEIKHEQLQGLDLTHDGKKIYTGGMDNTIRVWECETGRELNRAATQDVRGQLINVCGLKLSHNQKIIAVCDIGSRIQLYDNELNSLGSIDGMGNIRHGAIDFSHNDLWISVGTDVGVLAFDIATGERVFYVRGHEENVLAADFGVDSRTLLSGGTDGVCYLWDTIPDESGISSIEQNYERLTGVGGTESFVAFHKLAATPNETYAYLEQKLSAAAKRQVSEKEIAKWIAAIGSSHSRRISIAKKKLLELGPTAYPMLIESLESDIASKQKRAQLQEIAVSIHCRYRRAVMLFAELESPEVDSSIDAILENAASSHWTTLFNEAKEARNRLNELKKQP